MRCWCTYLTWIIGFSLQKEQIVDGVHDVLGLHILLRFVLTSFGHGSVKTYMCDSFHNLGKLLLTLRELVLKHIVASKRKNQVLKDVNWCLSSKQKDTVCKQATLRFRSFESFLHSYHFWSVLKFLIDRILARII